MLVLRGCGPKGYPGMPEVSNMPMPAKLLQRGVRDMVRICDGRMSGTAYGTVVLHVAPEARGRAARWPWSGPATGSRWTCRAAGSTSRCPRTNCASDRWRGHDRRPGHAAAGLGAPVRGHRAGGADGADLDFLRGATGHMVERESH